MMTMTEQTARRIWFVTAWAGLAVQVFAMTVTALHVRDNTFEPLLLSIQSVLLMMAGTLFWRTGITAKTDDARLGKAVAERVIAETMVQKTAAAFVTIETDDDASARKH
jgi:hypothetical protein